MKTIPLSYGMPVLIAKTYTIAEADPTLVIEACPQLNGSVLWAIRQRSNVLNQQGFWEFEPQPSSRTKAFFKRARFSSEREALMFLCTPASKKLQKLVSNTLIQHLLEQIEFEAFWDRLLPADHKSTMAAIESIISRPNQWPGTEIVELILKQLPARYKALIAAWWEKTDKVNIGSQLTSIIRSQTIAERLKY